MHTVLTDTQRDRHAYTTLLKLLTHNLYGGTASHRMNTCMYNRKLVVNLNQKLMKLICRQIIVASYLVFAMYTIYGASLFTMPDYCIMIVLHYDQCPGYVIRG